MWTKELVKRYNGICEISKKIENLLQEAKDENFEITKKDEKWFVKDLDGVLPVAFGNSALEALSASRAMFEEAFPPHEKIINPEELAEFLFGEEFQLTIQSSNPGLHITFEKNNKRIYFSDKSSFAELTVVMEGLKFTVIGVSIQDLAKKAKLILNAV